MNFLDVDDADDADLSCLDYYTRQVIIYPRHLC